MRRALALVAVALFCAYAGASYFVPPDHPQLAVVPLVGAFGISVLLASGRWWPAALLPVAAAVAMAALAPPRWLVYAPPSLFDFIAAAVFLGSLREGREPVIARFARIAHGGTLDPCFDGYTRLVTLAWGLFLLLLGVIAAGLAGFAPHAWWWTFSNVIVYPLFLAFFLGEYAIRLRTFPDFDHVSPLRLISIVHREGVIARAAATAQDVRK